MAASSDRTGRRRRSTRDRPSMMTIRNSASISGVRMVRSMNSAPPPATTAIRIRALRAVAETCAVTGAG